MEPLHYSRNYLEQNIVYDARPDGMHRVLFRRPGECQAVCWFENLADLRMELHVNGYSGDVIDIVARHCGREMRARSYR